MKYAKIIFTILILFFLIYYSQLNLDLLYIFIKHPFLTLIYALLCYFSVGLNTWRWYRLNHIQNMKLAFSKMLAPTYLGLAFNNILPGNIGGEFFRLYYMLKRFPGQKNAVVVTIFFDRILGLIGMMLLICIFAPYYLNSMQHNKTLFYLFIMSIFFCVAALIIFVVFLFLLKKTHFIDRLAKKATPHSYILNKLISFLKVLYIYRNSKLIILENIFISMISQTWMLFIILLINKLMNLPMLPPLNCLIALIIGQIANLIPFTPGGIGIGEAAFANTLLILNPGITAAYATVFLAWRLLIMLMYLPGIVIGILKFNRGARLYKNLT